MLSIFFPELIARFNQPLSGMIASKKSLLQQVGLSVMTMV
jgi:hypothetical protein